MNWSGPLKALFVLTWLRLGLCLRTSSEGDKVSFNHQWSLYFPCINMALCWPPSVSTEHFKSNLSSWHQFLTSIPHTPSFAVLFPESRRNSDVSFWRLLVIRVAAASASAQPILALVLFCFSTVYYFMIFPSLALASHSAWRRARWNTYCVMSLLPYLNQRDRSWDSPS